MHHERELSHVGRSEADRELRRIAAVRAGCDAEEARWLRVARREGLHRLYGYATLLEYLERVLGYAPHSASERLRVAEELEFLPAIEQALASGRVCWSAVREMTRIARPETERELLGAVEGHSLREVEEILSGLPVGGLPGDARDPDLVRKKLRFDVPAATWALFREARRRIELDAGGSLDDGEVLAEMCRVVLGGPADEGRASYQIALTMCERCDRAWQDGAGQAVEVPGVVLEQAMCDAQEIGRVGGDAPGRAVQSVPPAVRRLVLRRDHGRCVVPGCRSSRFLDVHHLKFRSDGGTHEPYNLVTLCGAHHAALHEGRVVIEGPAPDLIFRRADGQAYASRAVFGVPEENPVAEDVRSALRKLGFRADEARAAVERAQSHVGREAPLEVLLREALKRARPAG